MPLTCTSVMMWKEGPKWLGCWMITTLKHGCAADKPRIRIRANLWFRPLICWILAQPKDATLMVGMVSDNAHVNQRFVWPMQTLLLTCCSGIPLTLLTEVWNNKQTKLQSIKSYQSINSHRSHIIHITNFKSAIEWGFVVGDLPAVCMKFEPSSQWLIVWTLIFSTNSIFYKNTVVTKEWSISLKH